MAAGIYSPVTTLHFESVSDIKELLICIMMVLRSEQQREYNFMTNLKEIINIYFKFFIKFLSYKCVEISTGGKDY
jgi:hypothetical protein